MMIFPDSDLIYFSIPKTGSTVFEQTFAKDIPNSVVVPENRKHMNVRQFEYDGSDPQFRQYGKRMERMAILREPIARLQSWYRFRRRLDRGNPMSTSKISFEEFISSTMLSSPPPHVKNIGDQWEFCIRKSGNLGITHIFDIANLHPLDDFLQTRLGRRFPRERINESMGDEIELSTKTEKRLRLHRQQEFSLYDSVVENGGYVFTDIHD